MSCYFHQASSEYLSIASAVLTATPLTMACWFFSYDSAPSDDQYLIDLHNSASDRFRDCFSLIASGFSGSRFGIIALTGEAAASDQADTNVATGRVWQPFQWQHACGVFAGATDRRAFLNFSDKATDTGSSTPSGINGTTIGRQTSTPTPGAYMFGRIADAAIWNAALEDAEVSMLAQGTAPIYVRRENLKAYWPLYGYGKPGYDVRQAFHLANTGTRPGLQHPTRTPKRKKYIFVSAPVVAAAIKPKVTEVLTAVHRASYW